jgi:hypothetical protein
MAEQSFEQQLAAAMAALGGGVIGKSLGGGGGNNVPPQLGQLLDMSLQQNAYQNPLRQAVTQGAYGMLPTFMREGTQLTGGLTNSVPAPGNYSGGGGGGVNKAGVAGGAGLAALAALLGKSGSGGEMNLSKIFNWIKSKFGHQVQGNKPYAGGALPSGNPGTFGGFEGWANDDFSGPQDFMGPIDQGPHGTVNTDEWMGQWPETLTPFDPFDPGQLPQGGGGDSFDAGPWEDGW